MAAAPPKLLLADVPTELVERILRDLKFARDLASVNAVSRLFRGGPGTASVVEHTLRERTSERGHSAALRAKEPHASCSWTEELLARERVLALARAHAHSAACEHSGRLSFSAFVSVDGGLYTCGEEMERDGASVYNGRYVGALALGQPGAPALALPTRVASLGTVRVCAVASGWEHLLALSECGAVYGCGGNAHGQLGLGDTDGRAAFAPVLALAGQVVVGVGAGGEHSLATTAAGAVYSWGRGDAGQLGHGGQAGELEPRRIAGLAGARVGGLAAGADHTLLLAAEGSVLSCGRGSHGQLGHGDRTLRPSPARIEALGGVRVVHVSAGSYHSLVVDADGGVRAFGHGARGCLGRGARRATDARTPRRVRALDGVRAVRARAGLHSSAVLGADGSVHTFGFNRAGLFGRGADAALDAPTDPARVDALAAERIVDVSLTIGHALYVTAGGAVLSCGKRTAALGHGEGAEAGLEDLATPTRVAQLPPLLPQQSGGGV